MGRVMKLVDQNKLETLLHKHKSKTITSAEKKELVKLLNKKQAN